MAEIDPSGTYVSASDKLAIQQGIVVVVKDTADVRVDPKGRASGKGGGGATGQ